MMNILVDIKILIYIELLKLRNYIKSLFNITNIMVKVMAYIVPICVLLLSSKTKGSSKISNIINNVSLINCIITCILILIFTITLVKSIKYPVNMGFSKADMNLLFISPISPKSIFISNVLINIFKSIMSNIFIIIIVFLMLSKYATIYKTKLIYLLISFIFISNILQSINFIIYNLVIKYDLFKPIKLLVRLLIVAMGGLIIFYTIKFNNILNASLVFLNNKIWDYTPIGMGKSMIISPLMGNNPLVETIELGVFTIALIIIAIYFAEDYYEEMIKVIEADVDLKNTNINEIIDEGRQNVKARNTREFIGEWSFLWKENLYNKKRVGITTKVICYIVYLSIPLVLGFVVKGDLKKLLAMYAPIFLGTTFIAPNVMSTLEYELTKPFIFLFPGKPYKKILGVCGRNIIDKIILSFMIIFPLVFFKVSIITCIFMWIAFSINTSITYISDVIIRLICSSKMLKIDGIVSIFKYILQVPSVFISSYVALKLNSLEIGLVIFNLMSILVFIISLVLNNKLFDRLELINK